MCTKIGSGATPRGGQEVYLESGPFSLIRSQNVRNEGFIATGLAFIVKGAKKLVFSTRAGIQIRPRFRYTKATESRSIPTLLLYPLVLLGNRRSRSRNCEWVPSFRFTSPPLPTTCRLRAGCRAGGRIPLNHRCGISWPPAVAKAALRRSPPCGPPPRNNSSASRQPPPPPPSNSKPPRLFSPCRAPT